MRSSLPVVRNVMNTGKNLLHQLLWAPNHMLTEWKGEIWIFSCRMGTYSGLTKWKKENLFLRSKSLSAFYQWVPAIIIVIAIIKLLKLLLKYREFQTSKVSQKYNTQTFLITFPKFSFPVLHACAIIPRQQFVYTRTTFSAIH